MAAGSWNLHDATKGHWATAPAPHWESQKGVEKNLNHSTVAAVTIVAAALFGVELADISRREASSLDSAIMAAIWGPITPCAAKEILIVFTLLLPRHRVAPSMVIPYRRKCWLAQLARNPGTDEHYRS